MFLKRMVPLRGKPRLGIGISNICSFTGKILHRNRGRYALASSHGFRNRNLIYLPAYRRQVRLLENLSFSSGLALLSGLIANCNSFLFLHLTYSQDFC